MHPDTFTKLKDEMIQAASDPDFNRAHDEIMQLKYSEWRDREADRKLVD